MNLCASVQNLLANLCRWSQGKHNTEHKDAVERQLGGRPCVEAFCTLQEKSRARRIAISPTVLSQSRG